MNLLMLKEDRVEMCVEIENPDDIVKIIDSSCMANIKFSATQNGRFCLHAWGQLYFDYSKVTVSWLSMHLFHCQPLTVCEQLT